MKKIITAILATSLVFCFATQAFANTASNDFTVSTTGEVTLKVAPDVAYINLGVETNNTSSSKASEENAKITNNLISVLKENGIADNDIKTQYYSVYPRYNYKEDSTQEIIGYTVSHSLSVTVRNLDNVGDILDIAIKNGANNNSGVSFDVENKDAYYQKALTEALNKAISKGNTLALTVGVTNPSVKSISENSSYSSPVMYASDTAAKGIERGTQIQSNDVSIYASVNVVLGQ